MRNKLVKISLLLISLLMLFCFASCGDEETPAPEKVKIEFELGRGSFVDEDFEGSIEIDKGTAIEEYPEVKRNGYTLKGWYFDEEYEEKCDASYEFNESVTLYARWEVTVFYTVKFDTSRAGAGQSVPSQTIEEGCKVTAPADPTKKGATFYGWCVGGDKNKKWDFDNDVVTENITLTAVFEITGGGNTSTCEHVFEIIESVAPTCKKEGKIVQKCTICRTQQRLGAADDPSLAKLEHLTLVETVEPTCALDGYERTYCPNGCGLDDVYVLKATGKHEYDEKGYYAVTQPTKYVPGKLENPCVVCGGAALTKETPYKAEDFELDEPDVSYLYTGGSYVNEKFVNIATHGRVEVSSYFTTAMGHLINDGDAISFWNADTYVDGADYTKDWFSIDFMQNYDIGALRFVLPNYYAWELGEDCYVSYDLEYWDTENEEWVSIGTVSDKNAVSIGINCELMLELDTPINTNKLRARVTHATRYTPAVVYELEVFAKTEETIRLPQAIHTEATASVSGKYNEWVSGAGALVDNSLGTAWTTDARYNPTPWALLEFPVEKYIACVQFSTSTIQGRAFKLEIYEDGKWVEVGSYTVPQKGALNENVISNANDVCTFNVEIEKKASKIKLTITKEPQYWNSVMYDITPYTVVEKAYGEMNTMECTHKNPRKGTVVAPTCETTGYTVVTCACGFEMKTAAKDALGHDFGKYTVENEATATAIGTKISSCKRDGCSAVSTITYEKDYYAPVVTPYLHNAPAAWAQTYDDGNYTPTYEWVNEHLAKYGARATVMMSITYSDALVSVWQEHFTRGVFDLGSHSYNHTSIYASSLSEGSMLHEVVDAQYWFRHNFKGQHLLAFAAPLGATSNDVAEYLTGPLAANRNGGDTGIFYNTIDQLTNRLVWGDLNSYISKADQTEGIYVYVNKNGGAFVANVTETPKLDADGNPVLDKDGNPVVDVTTEYVWSADVNQGNAGPALLLNAVGKYVEAETPNVNLVFDETEMKFVDVGYEGGTYRYIAEDYRYDFFETGSYNYVDGEFVFVDGNDGEYRLLKTTIGSYEKGVEKLVSVGGFTVECLHTVGFTNVIYSSYESTISKLEHLTRFGVWAASYNDLVRYLKEAQNVKIDTLERTDSSITISVTDNLDNYMYNHAITVKVDIPNGWKSVTVTQNGAEIPFVSMSEYSHTKNMSTVSCAIEDGYLYVDVVPDGGDVVITVGDRDEEIDDYEEKVTVTFEPGEGELGSLEYEARVEKGNVCESFPTPVREGYKFLGWYFDEEYANKAVEGVTIFSEDVTLYAKWESIPLCNDGTYNHKWGNWIPTATGQERACKNCAAIDVEVIETPEENPEGTPEELPEKIPGDETDSETGTEELE
ncbi:MAG: hypothetical protein E7596_00710 [Ruminococcaceae bacterium]|nr:hypothetical protein [Oscillospiraceae bacterium]